MISEWIQIWRRRGISLWWFSDWRRSGRGFWRQRRWRAQETQIFCIRFNVGLWVLSCLCDLWLTVFSFSWYSNGEPCGGRCLDDNRRKELKDLDKQVQVKKMYHLVKSWQVVKEGDCGGGRQCWWHEFYEFWCVWERATRPRFDWADVGSILLWATFIFIFTWKNRCSM